MEYSDFDLQIEPRRPGRYRARVVESPGGEASHEFAFPFSDLELENFLLRMGHARRRMRRLEAPETQAAKAFGGQLFESVFAGPVRSALASSLSATRREEKGLRIRLRLTDVPELGDIPWEFLYDSSLNRFLGLSKETPIVRFLELADPPRALAVKPPLAALVIIASPSDYPPLDAEEEWRRLSESLADLQQVGLISVDRLPIATFSQLQRQLNKREYHVVHFIGHGGFDESAQDGALVLEDERGRGRVVSGQDLGVMLGDHRSLRLVVLNACEGARAGKADPFAGCAQSLLQQSVPAVIAMQFEISDEAAVAFSREFYAGLAHSYPVDAALAEARRAIFAGDNEIEWGTPVLYTRSDDGRLFNIQPVQALPRNEVEPDGVPAQVAPPPAQRANARMPAPQRVPAPSGEGAAPGKRSRRVPALLFGLVALLAAVLLLWRPWDGRAPPPASTSRPPSSLGVVTPVRLTPNTPSPRATVTPGPTSNPIVARPTGELRVAILAPLTGEVPAFGVEARRGAELAIREWNARGGVIGRKISPVVLDSQCQADPAAQAATAAIEQERIRFVIGEVCSKASIAVAEIANSRKVIQLSPSSTNPSVTVGSNGRTRAYVFRACFIDPFQGTVGARFAVEQLQAKTAYVMVDQENEYARGLAEYFMKEFTAGGGTVVRRSAYSATDTDFSAIVAQIRDANPDVVYLPDYYNVVNRVVPQARAAGIRSVFLGGDGWDSTNLDTRDAAGSYFTNHYSADSTVPESVAFRSAYEKAYEGATPGAIAALSYDATNLLLSAIDAADSDDVVAVRKELEQTSFPGVTGKISFDAQHNPIKPAVIIEVTEGGLRYHSTVEP